MRQKVGGPRRPMQLIDRRDRVDPRLRVRPLTADDALHLLRGSLVDPVQMAAIRRWWADRGQGAGRSDMRLLSDIATAIRDRRIGLIERKKIIGASGGTGGLTQPVAEAREARTPPPRRPGRDPTREEGPSQPVPPPSEVRTWIEFRLLDEATDTPVSGTAFQIELPGGEVVTRTTDGAGLIRIEDIDPGRCGIREIAAEDGPEVTEVI